MLASRPKSSKRMANYPLEERTMRLGIYDFPRSITGTAPLAGGQTRADAPDFSRFAIFYSLVADGRRTSVRTN
ncbi:hypothetical protein V1477_015691 [Vespula maculifrons]|uniref:Uncharacterized protein n=1 Tax=Vespula maculifrons TaxID=7453 RepID=A0ABD2BAZ3_VESMC